MWAEATNMGTVSSLAPVPTSSCSALTPLILLCQFHFLAAQVQYFCHRVEDYDRIGQDYGHADQDYGHTS